MKRLHGTLASAALGLAITLAPSAVDAQSKDLLVQPPSIGQPERGSIAGSLSKLAFGPGSLSRGLYALPLGIDAPGERGELLAGVIPAYSAEGGIGEWGVGWATDLSIKRHRVIGEIDFTSDDSFTSPWGRLVRGDDGSYYPAGLHTMVRLTFWGAGWEATTPDGTRYFFDLADAQATPDGIYQWNLSAVRTLFGDSTTLTWTKNATGRAFLSRVIWGGRDDGTQYEMAFAYEPLATPFVSYVSGTKTLLDQRVTRVTASVKSGGAYVERWRHDLAYVSSPNGPAFYLASVTKRFASGEVEPPVTYQYDFSTDLLETATFSVDPDLSAVLAAYGSGAIQPDKASMTDVERNGLTDMEVHLDNTLVRQTEGGYLYEPLPPPTGAENPLCRPAPSSTNKPRYLARMHGDADQPNVVVTMPNSYGTQTRVIICDRAGFTQYDQWLAGAWSLGANNRLADVDLDHRPDLVRVAYGSVQVLRNTATSATSFSFAPGPTTTLTPKVVPTASWILDGNGDGRPDLMVRHGGGVVIWRGIGFGKFDPTGTTFPFITRNGTPLSYLSTYQFSHGDFNNDGLSDVILTKGQTVLLFTNRGSSFVEVPVTAFAQIPWTVMYPVIADLSGTGNEQVVMADGTQAEVLQLSRASTGMLLRADDGKGSVITFDYGRVAPAPGVNQLYSILQAMTVQSSGYDTVTYRYSYGAPVWHTIGKYLIGFAEARKASPFLDETVEFHNDNDVAGVETASHDEDERIPGLVRFSERALEPASFHGVPWLRMLWIESGWRTSDGTAKVSTRTDMLAYDATGLCATVMETSGPSGVLRHEMTFVDAAALDPEMTCLVGSERVIGRHDDPSLDFAYQVDIERDDHGRLTSAWQVGADGARLLQQVSYDAMDRVASITTPGAGTSSFTYEPVSGHLTSVTAPDGVVTEVLARDPITDDLLQSRVTRGNASWDNFAAYDGRERLRAIWDSASGSSAAQPLKTFEYVYATIDAPGRILERHLVDASAGTASEVADLMAADGAVIARALLQPGGWSLSGMTQVDRGDLETRSYVRDPLPSLAGVTHASLFAGATLVGASTHTGSGSPRSTWATVETGVLGNTQTSLALLGGELVTTVNENGHVTRTASGGDGKLRWFEDQNGVVTAYDHDAMGRLRRVHTPSGDHHLDFDSYGLPSRVEREGVQQIEWSYDPVTGHMSERRDRTADGALDRTTIYQRDEIGRLVRTIETKAATGETRTVEMLWDGALPGILWLPGQLGYATSTTIGDLEKVTYRNPDGKIAWVRWELAGWRSVEQSTTYYASGATRSVTTLVKDGGGTVLTETVKEYDYDAYGRVVRCRVNGDELFSLTYDSQGRTQSAHLASGDVTIQYDATTRARTGYTMTGGVAGAVSWRKNVRGTIAEETYTLGGSTRHRGYTYDGRGFLTAMADESSAATYAYDETGLISAATDHLGSRPITRTATTIAAGDRSYGLDAMGRVVSQGGLTVAYGPSGHLEQAWRDGHALRFVYDESGQRILKYRDGAPVAAYINGAYLDASALVEPVNVAGVMVGVLRNGVFERLPFDARGTVISDAAGALALATPYGARSVWGPYAEAIDFVTKGYDPDLGVVRMGVRDYDPLLGQFWTPDPLFLTSIDRCAASPAECNLYGYAKNNPIDYTDPTGTDARAGVIPQDMQMKALKSNLSKEGHMRPYLDTDFVGEDDWLDNEKINIHATMENWKTAWGDAHAYYKHVVVDTGSFWDPWKIETIRVTPEPPAAVAEQMEAMLVRINMASGPMREPSQDRFGADARYALRILYPLPGAPRELTAPLVSDGKSSTTTGHGDGSTTGGKLNLGAKSGPLGGPEAGFEFSHSFSKSTSSTQGNERGMTASRAAAEGYMQETGYLVMSIDIKGKNPVHFFLVPNNPTGKFTIWSKTTKSPTGMPGTAAP